MRRYLILSALLVFAFSSLRLLAQSDICANPTAPRVGIVTGPQSKASDPIFAKRKADVEGRFSQALIKQLGPDVCVVRDSNIFSDPKNFPALKGSMLFRIEAQPSLKNDGIAAIAVRGDAIQGANIEQSVSVVLCHPVLIEKDSDFSTGAQGVLMT